MKKREHRFIDRHPIAGSIILGFLMLVIVQVFGETGEVISRLSGFRWPELIAIVFILAGGLLILAWYKHHFNPEFKGILTGGDFKLGMILCLPFIVYWIVTTIAMMIDHSFELKTVSLEIIKISIMAGVSEEIGFRHGVLSTLLRNRNKKELIIRNCMISAIAFGLIHLLNISMGADLLHTFSQVITAGSHGVFFAAIFVSCGNILPCIIIHTVHDIFAISTSTAVTDGGVVIGSMGFSDIVDIIACVAMAVYALKFYLSPEKLDRIVELWDHKWSKEEFKKTEGRETTAEEA